MDAAQRGSVARAHARDDAGVTLRTAARDDGVGLPSFAASNGASAHVEVAREEGADARFVARRIERVQILVRGAYHHPQVRIRTATAQQACSVGQRGVAIMLARDEEHRPLTRERLRRRQGLARHPEPQRRLGQQQRGEQRCQLLTAEMQYQAQLQPVANGGV